MEMAPTSIPQPPQQLLREKWVQLQSLRETARSMHPMVGFLGVLHICFSLLVWN